jgi:hypothetical protein
MAQDQVPEGHGGLLREVRQAGEPGVQHLDPHDDVPHQPPRVGVLHHSVVGELMDLADVVEDAAGDQEVPVGAGVMIRRPIQEPRYRQGVFQEPPDGVVVKTLGGGGPLEATDEGFIPEEGREEGLQVGRGDPIHESHEFSEHFLGVSLAGGKEIHRIDICLFQLLDPQDVELNSVPITDGPGVDLHEIPFLEGLVPFGGMIPDLAVHLSRAVLQLEAEVGSPLLREGQIFLRRQEDLADLVSLPDIPDKYVFHVVFPIRSSWV